MGLSEVAPCPPKMPTISASIIAYNSAEKIEAAILSVLWADEIVVADSASTDGTAEIATQLGARVVQIPFNGFGDLRNRAVEACCGKWVFSLDTDERCTPAVRDEVLALIAGEPTHDAFLVPRRNYMMGRWVRGSGWYPNYRQPQLFRKGTIRYRLDPVHEGYELLTSRPLGRLRNDIWQFPFRNLEEILDKANRYSTLGARRIKCASPWSALGHATWAFLKHFIAKRGFYDGWVGFFIAFGNFEGTFYRYAKAYEAAQGWRAPPPERILRESSSETSVTSAFRS